MKLKFDVTGMTCAACSARVEKVPRAVAGVETVEVNLLAGKMSVEASEDVSAAIEKAVVDAGYGIAHPEQKKKQDTPANDALKEMKKRIIGSAIFLVILMYFTMGHMIHLPVPHWYHSNGMMAALLQFFLTLPAVYLNEAGDERASHGAFLSEQHIEQGQIPPEGTGCRVYDSLGQFIMTGKSGQLDRGGEAIFCDKTFFNRD